MKLADPGKQYIALQQRKWQQQWPKSQTKCCKMTKISPKEEQEESNLTILSLVANILKMK